MLLKWWIYLTMLFVMGTLFSNIIDGIEIGNFDASPLGVVLTKMGIVNVQTDMGTLAGAETQPGFWDAVRAILSWDYSFLQGNLFGYFPLEILRVLLFAITFGILFEIGMGLINTFRGLIRI